MQLEEVAAVATVVALLILAYVHAKRAINRWATAKFLRSYSELHMEDLLTREQALGLPWPQRLRRARRHRVYRLVQRLTTRAHCIAQYDLVEQLDDALNRPEFLPVSPDCDPLVLEAAAVSKHDWERRQARRRARVHKRVLCAGGCGTRYGKRRHDHNFSGGGGVEGGWRCLTNTSCVREPTGEHYCGMCDFEARFPRIRQHPRQPRDPAACSEGVETTVTNHQGLPEDADERASEQDSFKSAPKPEEQRAARPPTEDNDATPAPMPAQITPENRRR